MSRILFFTIVFLSVSTLLNSQVIRGTILDAKDKKPVQFATVYINGSFVAVYSDQKGEFEINITGYSSMPVIVSALGYYSVTITGLGAGNQLTIYLKPKVFELNEIVVTASNRGGKKNREKNLKLFKSVFIGETLNSQKCEILNENDLRFQFSPNGDTMKVYAANPIIIKNKALGYTVTYFLDSFAYCEADKLLDMTGNILFREDTIIKNRERKLIEKRRIRAYIGSRMHFFRALYAGKLTEEGFKISSPLRVLTYEEATGIKDTTNQADLPKIILYQQKLPESYWVEHTSKVPVSVMRLRNEFVIFKKNGYYDGAAVIWEGEMAKQRLGDWLPYEYKLEY